MNQLNRSSGKNGLRWGSALMNTRWPSTSRELYYQTIGGTEHCSAIREPIMIKNKTGPRHPRQSARGKVLSKSNRIVRFGQPIFIDRIRRLARFFFRLINSYRDHWEFVARLKSI